MDHSGQQELRVEGLRPRKKQPQFPRLNAFRERGFSFARQAGTQRRELGELMWQSKRDWIRMAMGAVLQVLPTTAPKPAFDPNHYLYTVPVADPEDFSFVLLGDTGMNTPGQYLVSTAICNDHLHPSDFCLILGDVIYPAGGEECYRFGLLEAFKHYKKPILAIPGNHDWYDRLSAFRRFFVRGHSVPHSGRAYRWQSPELPNWFYAMDFGESLRIICLDTGTAGKMEHHSVQQLRWLDHMLDTAGERKVLLMTHHPLYSLNRRGHEPRLRELLEPRLDRANVVGIFSGHDHNYQRHMVRGRQQIVQGAGGATLYPLPDFRKITFDDGESTILNRRHAYDRDYCFTHCRWRDGRLTGTTVSGHTVPGRILDQFVL